MNPAGVVLAAITGLLAAYLYLTSSAHVDQQQQESQAEMRCQTARFNASFAKKWDEAASNVAALNQEAVTECANFESKRTESLERSTARSTDNSDLKNTIGNLMK